MKKKSLDKRKKYDRLFLFTLNENNVILEFKTIKSYAQGVRIILSENREYKQRIKHTFDRINFSTPNRL